MIAADPTSIEGLTWLGCYLTSGKHIDFYWSFLIVLGLLAITAPIALTFGFFGAMATRSLVSPLRWLGNVYIGMVRGVPDIVYFLFFVIALDQGIECLEPPDSSADGRPDPAGAGVPRLPRGQGALGQFLDAVWHRPTALRLAVFTFAIVFGAFAANVLHGAMNAVPSAQLETAESLWHDQRPGLSPHPCSADVALRAARACRTCG